jgi:hypothetical protein
MLQWQPDDADKLGLVRVGAFGGFHKNPYW